MHHTIKITILSAIAALIPTLASAQSERSIVEVINDSVPDVTVVQSAAIGALLQGTSTPDGQTANTNGIVYRVEVFTDNSTGARARVEQLKEAIEQTFPGMRGHLIFDSPYWILRMGDYSSHSSASAALTDIRDAFPAYSNYLRVVRARVKPTE